MIMIILDIYFEKIGPKLKFNDFPFVYQWPNGEVQWDILN
jgi:hypothetical protein